MSANIVAELDRWLDNSNDSSTAIERRVVLHARDEIVALRQKNVEVMHLVAGEIKRRARDEALEEAAQVCERMARHAEGVGQPGFTEAFEEVCATLSAAIRALKER